jgi:hypothetical protein
MQLMYLSPVTRQIFQAQDLRGREGLGCPPDDKDCLPLTEPLKQAAPKAAAPTITSNTHTDDGADDATSANSSAVALKQLTVATAIGVSGLFIALVGWRKRRSLRRYPPT